MKKNLLTKGKGILLVLLCLMSAFSMQAVNVIPYLTALQSFGGTSADLATFTPIEGDYTLEVVGAVGVQISVAGGFYTYTPTTSGTVRFVQRIGKVYVYEGNTYMTSIIPTFTITYPTITDAGAATNVNNLLRNASFETTGTLISGTAYKFGTPWSTNVTETSGSIRINSATGLTNGSYVCVWRGSANNNYFAQPILSTIKPNTSYKVIVRQTAGGNANAYFNFGLGSTVNGMEYDYKPLYLGKDETGLWSIVLHTTQNVSGTTYFTVRNTPTNSASSGTDPVAQMDYLALVEGTLSVSTTGITGVSSATFLSGTAYAPEGVAINYAGGDCYDVTSKVLNPSLESNLCGWTNTGSWAVQTNTSPTWTKDGINYVEKWIAAGSNLTAASLTQTISSLPNGKYKLTMSGHATQGASTSTTGAYAFAGLASTAVNASGNYVVDIASVAAGSLQIGFKLEGTITSNWAAFDNFKLYYYGEYSEKCVSLNSLRQI